MTATLRLFCFPALLLLAALFLAAPVQAQPQPFEFAVQGAGPGSDGEMSQDVATDAAGNSYVVGTFEETITFGSVTLTAADDGSFSGAPSDIFIVKYDPSGNALWARRGGTAEFNDTGEDVAVDASGNVLVAGTVSGVDTTAFFDGGSNPDSVLAPSDGRDPVVAKYNPQGDLLWVRKADSSMQPSGETGDAGEAVATDASGNVYIAGSFESTLGFGTETLTSAGESDVFVVKYGPDGDFAWARRGGSGSGSFPSDEARGVGVGPDGNVYAMGEFSSVATFGSESVASAGQDDLFLVKYSPAGNVIWLSSVGGSQSEYDFGIAVDGEGASYLAGAFQGTLLINNDLLTATGFTDVFVAKIDSSGNAVWGRRGGGDGTNFRGGISADADGNVYHAGYIGGNNVTFGSESVTLQGDGTDAFLAAYRSDGTVRRVVAMGGPDNDEGTGTAVTPDGTTVYATGFFRGTATFGSEMLTSQGGTDVFTTQSLAGNLPVELTSFQAAADGPDAVLSWQTASETGNDGFGVEWKRDGASAWQEVAFVEGAGTTTEAQQYRHRVTDLAPGQHRFRLRQVDTDGDATYSTEVEVTIGPDGAYALSSAYPNPTSTQARLRLTVQEEQSVQVSLYNTLGQRVQVLHDGPVTPGEARTFTVEAGTLASGLYIVRVEGENFDATRTLTLVR